MGGGAADRGCSHPGFGRGAVQLVAVQGDVGRQDKAVFVVGRDGHLTLCDGNTAGPGDHVHFFAVGNGLKGLDRPDSQPLVGVDAARDVGKG